MRPDYFIWLLLLIVVSPITAAEPTQLGYERWTHTGSQHGVIFQKEPKWYYGTFADKLVLADTGFPMPQPAPYRLIDIEITSDYQLNYFMDAVWVENRDHFKTGSWMLYDLTYDDVKSIAQFENGVILDIESYEEQWGVETLYALILKENPDEFPTKILLEATWETILSEINNGYWRPIDIDILRDGYYEYSEPEAWDDVRYNAVLVDNSGENFIYTLINEAQHPSEIQDMKSKGFQLIDMEPRMACVNPVSSCPVRMDEPCEHTCDVGTKFLTVYVNSGLPFELHWGMTDDESVQETENIPLFYDVAEKLGRCVDVEGAYWNPAFNPTGRSGVFLVD